MFPVQITFRDVDNSEALETHLRKHSEKLNHFYDRIISCRVVVEMTQKHKHQGKLYNVRIDLNVPGKEIVATHKSDEDFYIAMRDAFQAVERRLEDFNHKRQSRFKKHSFDEK